MPIVLFAELCLIYAENPFRMIKNVLNMLKKTPLWCSQRMLYVLKCAKRANFSTIGIFVNLLMDGLSISFVRVAVVSNYQSTWTNFCTNLPPPVMQFIGCFPARLSQEASETNESTVVVGSGRDVLRGVRDSLILFLGGNVCRIQCNLVWQVINPPSVERPSVWCGMH